MAAAGAAEGAAARGAGRAADAGLSAGVAITAAGGAAGGAAAASTAGAADTPSTTGAAKPDGPAPANVGHAPQMSLTVNGTVPALPTVWRRMKKVNAALGGCGVTVK